MFSSMQPKKVTHVGIFLLNKLSDYNVRNIINSTTKERLVIDENARPQQTNVENIRIENIM